MLFYTWPTVIFWFDWDVYSYEIILSYCTLSDVCVSYILAIKQKLRDAARVDLYAILEISYTLPLLQIWHIIQYFWPQIGVFLVCQSTHPFNLGNNDIFQTSIIIKKEKVAK